MAAVDGWLDSDLITRLETGDAFADGLDGATELMTDRDGQFLLGHGMRAGWREAEISGLVSILILLHVTFRLILTLDLRCTRGYSEG